jgi:hypothetical protein
MTTKLTLSIDEDVIKKAKQISRRKGKSLSKMIEDYFKNISEKEGEKKLVISRIDKIMEPYRSKIKIPVNGSYKDIIRQWRYQDYMNKDIK